MDIWLKFILIALLAFAGSFIQRVTGFGFGILVMIFLPSLIEGYGSATLLSGLASWFMTLYVVITYRKEIKWKILIPCVLCGMVTNYLAVEFMKGHSNTLLKSLLSIVLIGLSIFFLVDKKEHIIKPHPLKGAVAGGLSGIMGGLFAMMGPPMVIYLFGSIATSTAYIATIQAHFMILGTYNIGLKFLAGYLTKEVLILIIPSMVGVFSGTYLGNKVSKKLDCKKLKTAVYVFMGISGVITLLTILL